jgi:hypothetical protein
MSRPFRIEFLTEAYQASYCTFSVKRVSHQKVDLGGYRDLIRNMVYRNAYSQTDQPQAVFPLCFDRNTQIFDTETKSGNPAREFGSQTGDVHLWIDPRDDKPIVPQKYFDSELWLQRRIEATLHIQKMVRGFLARNRMSTIKHLSHQIAEERTNLIDARRKHSEFTKMQEIEKRIHPKAKVDFQNLYKELNTWKSLQTQRVKEDKRLNEIEKHKIFRSILNTEIEMLQTLDKQFLQSNKQLKKEKIDTFLETLGKEKRWRNSDGRFNPVQTAFTTRASQLYQIYKQLHDYSLTLVN